MKGEKKTAAEELAAICDALGVSYEYFYEVAAGGQDNT